MEWGKKGEKLSKEYLLCYVMNDDVSVSLKGGNPSAKKLFGVIKMIFYAIQG
jgi:hypothetical protein